MNKKLSDDVTRLTEAYNNLSGAFIRFSLAYDAVLNDIAEINKPEEDEELPLFLQKLKKGN